jgi:hypothetical protein
VDEAVAGRRTVVFTSPPAEWIAAVDPVAVDTQTPELHEL